MWFTRPLSILLEGIPLRLSRSALHLTLSAFCLLTSVLTVQAQPRRDDAGGYALYEAEYLWREIEDLGEPLVNLRDNDFQGPFDIGFRFPFFGRLYDQFWISSNGFIGFGPADGYQNAVHAELPDDQPPDNLIALYWKDLNPQMFWGRAAIYRANWNGNLIVEYQRLAELVEEGRSPDNTITMQVILEPDGDIILQYQTVGEAFDLSTGSIGIEGSGGEQGLTLLHDGEGIEVASQTAFLVSTHGPGRFLIWDAGAVTTSGDEQGAALRELGHRVAHLKLRLNQALPNDLRSYEAVFVNLGNHGLDGQAYHALTAEEGRILDDYLRIGGSLYLEGGDTWARDEVTAVHPRFFIEGLRDGGPASPPVTGQRGTLAEGLIFDGYQAQLNQFVDHIRSEGEALDVFTFVDRGNPAVGMVAYNGLTYATIGASFEFGGLVDGERGTKLALMERIVQFFRSAPPEFPPPRNLRVDVDDREVRLAWDPPRPGDGDRQRMLELRRMIRLLADRREGGKPSDLDRRRLAELRTDLNRHLAAAHERPRRDDLTGYVIYVDGEELDATNVPEYTVIELENGRAYEFSIRARYEDPDRLSEPLGPVSATPIAALTIGFSTDFEQNGSGLVGQPLRGGWEWGVPAVGAASGQRAWGTLLNRPYGDLATWHLYLPVIDLTRARRAYLDFKHFYDTEPGWDGGRIEYSLDNGARWELLYPVSGYPDNAVFAFDEGPAFSGRSNGWRPVSCDLSQFAGQRMRVRLTFKSDDSNLRDYAGWFIDDLVLPRLGSINVRVVDAAGGAGLEGAQLTLDNNWTTFTAGNGQASFLDIPVGRRTLRAAKTGYISQERALDILPDSTINTGFALEIYDSQLLLDPENVDGELDFGTTTQVRVTLRNNGAMATDYRIYLDYNVGRQNAGPEMLDEAQDEVPRRDPAWDHVRTIDLTAPTGEQYFYGATMIATGAPADYQFITTAGEFGRPFDPRSRFYWFDRDGRHVRTADQPPEATGWGIRDLTYDGRFVYGAYASRLQRFNPTTGVRDGELAASPLPLSRAVAWVPSDSTYWIGDRDNSWIRMSATGQVLDRYTAHGLRGVMGMAWNPADPDGMHLYIHNQESDDGGAAIYRWNPRTRQLVRQLVTAAPEEGFPGGAFITYLYDTRTWMLGVVIQGRSRDLLKIYELHPRANWVTVSPGAGAVAAQGSTELTVGFDGSYYLEGLREARMEVHDLRRGEIIAAPITLTVHGGPGRLFGQVTFDREAMPFLARVSLNNRTVQPDFVGRFVFTNIFPGRYRLTATMPGFAAYASDSFAVAADAEIERNFQMQHLPFGRVVGRAVSVYDNQAGLAGVEVSAVTENGRARGIDTTDNAGAYDLLVPPGRYRIVARMRGWQADREVEVEVQDDSESEANFILDDRMAVRGIVANGYSDSQIRLSWLPPGIDGDTTVLRYDTGVLANGFYLRGRDDITAVKYRVEGEYDIAALTLYQIRNADFNGAFWPDGQYQQIFFYVFAEDPNTGLPGELLWSQQILNNSVNGTTTLLPRTLRFLSGNFFFGWSQHPDNNPDNVPPRVEAVGLDPAFDTPGSVYLRLDGVWRLYNGLPGDPIMRATVYRYQDGEERDIAPERRLRAADEVFAKASPEVVLCPVPGVPVIVPGLPEVVRMPDRNRLPRRDPPEFYSVFVDDELVEETDLRTYTHVVGSENEDHEYRYRIDAFYQDESRIEGPEVAGRANMPPGRVGAIALQRSGADYTVSWTAPAINADGTQCIDYAGCEVSIDGQAVATVREELIYRGSIQDGQEGWKTFHFIALDEVPNRSAPRDTLLPVGLGQYYDFESALVAVFSPSPFGSWSRSSALGNVNNRTGPGRANRGRYAWATRPGQGRYDNSAEWFLTTVNEYIVTSRTARVEFYHWYATEASHDGGQLQISVDGGPWTLLEPAGGYPDQSVGALQNLPGWTGANGDWQLVTADLSPYLGRGIRLRFRFASDDDINWYPGWYIDDLTLWGTTVAVYAQAYGFVRDLEGAALAGALVTTTRGSVLTGQNGSYRITGLLPGRVTFTATKPGYRASEMALDLAARDSLRLDFDLDRPTVALAPDSVQFSLGGNEQIGVGFSVTNEGQLPLDWRIRITPSGGWRDAPGRGLRPADGNAPGRDEPWERLFQYDIRQITGLARVMGAEFLNGKFFVSAFDPSRGAQIGVMTEDGRLSRTFAQPLQRLTGWGLRDLATDGTLLYGSQDSLIYAFRPDGAAAGSQRGAPLQVNRALAWDPGEDGFWATEWDQPWYLVNRDGEVLVRWDGHGLRGVYGLAWHPGDGQGMHLYALNFEPDGTTGIYRADPESDRIESVHTYGGPPTGAFITGDWDRGRWVLGLVHGTSPQFLTGLEIQPRVSWIVVEPLEGGIEPDETVEFDLTLGVPQGARGGEILTADVAFWSEGAAQAILPVRVDVIEGFRHFNVPDEGDEGMIIHIEAASLLGQNLAISSEIAAISPRNRVGGLARWLGRPLDLTLFHHGGAFLPGDALAFRLWDAVSGREYVAIAEYAEGIPFFQVGAEATVSLAAAIPVHQTVPLARGWNLVSSFVRPVETDIRLLLGPVLQREHLLLVKDGLGRFWSPRWNFINLGPWDALSAYQVNVSEGDSFIVTGERIPANQAIPLIQSWNSVSYLLDRPVATETALARIMDDIVIAKNGAGDFIAPPFGFFGMRTMLPGQGYRIKMRQARDLVYQAGELAALPGDFNAPPPRVRPTGSDMSLLLVSLPPDIESGTKVVVRTAGESGVVIGEGNWTGEALGVALMGDDPLTGKIDGAQDGESFEIYLATETGLRKGTSEALDGRLVWAADAFAVIAVTGWKEGLPASPELSPAWPNPFNARTVVRFGLPEAAWTRLRVHDLAGRVVHDTGRRTYVAGWHFWTINGEIWPSGIYMLEVQLGSDRRQMKVVLMR
ncbi:MAG: hypothetical protein FJY67_00490 [Calditrichaeota bacterium]|nr:hypothetical protein [Calditrichota bacterium]